MALWVIHVLFHLFSSFTHSFFPFYMQSYMNRHNTCRATSLQGLIETMKVREIEYLPHNHPLLIDNPQWFCWFSSLPITPHCRCMCSLGNHYYYFKFLYIISEMSSLAIRVLHHNGSAFPQCSMGTLWCSWGSGGFAVLWVCDGVRHGSGH